MTAFCALEGEEEEVADVDAEGEKAGLGEREAYCTPGDEWVMERSTDDAFPFEYARRLWSLLALEDGAAERVVVALRSRPADTDLRAATPAAGDKDAAPSLLLEELVLLVVPLLLLLFPPPPPNALLSLENTPPGLNRGDELGDRDDDDGVPLMVLTETVLDTADGILSSVLSQSFSVLCHHVHAAASVSSADVLVGALCVWLRRHACRLPVPRVLPVLFGPLRPGSALLPPPAATWIER